jgi:hypothetical protein
MAPERLAFIGWSNQNAADNDVAVDNAAESTTDGLRRLTSYPPYPILVVVTRRMMGRFPAVAGHPYCRRTSIRPVDSLASR